MTEAFIYDAIRSPRGKGRPDGALHEVTSVNLSAQILNAIQTRNGLEGHAVEDVISLLFGDMLLPQFILTHYGAS